MQRNNNVTAGDFGIDQRVSDHGVGVLLSPDTFLAGDGDRL
jgi:hypothetical protein